MLIFLIYFFFFYLLPTIIMALIVRYREKLDDYIVLPDKIFGYLGIVFVPVYNFICLLTIIVYFIILLIEKISEIKIFQFLNRKIKEFLRLE